MIIHKHIIVGSGPIGYHVFNKLNNKSILITGQTKKKILSKKLHPKIKLELKKQTNKFTDLIYSKKDKFYIYSSAEIGGFTNYWGKQFFDYKKDENWPKEIFKNFSKYKKNLETIDKLYSCPKSKIIKKDYSENQIFKQLTPPILKTLLVNKQKVKKKFKKKLIYDRVIYFEKIKKNLVKVVTEQKILYCENLILCAGPVGNGLILLRSFKKIQNFTFKDDNPRMIFGLKYGHKFNSMDENVKLADFDIYKNNKLINYSTIYNIEPNHFNRFFKPIVKLLRKILVKFFFYGQFWVRNEYNEIKVSNNKKIISLSGKHLNFKRNYVNNIKSIKKIGFKILKIQKLNFAYGFHYHCLKVKYQNKLYPINKFLNKVKVDKDVYCFDSSVIDKIGLKPPTKTFLATANYLIKNNFNK